MNKLGSRWWRTNSGVIIGLGLIAIGITVILVLAFKQEWDAADKAASVIGGLLACGGAAVALWTSANTKQQSVSEQAAVEKLDQAASFLAAMVHDQWIEEARIRALDDPEPMPIRWRLASPGLMDDPEVITQGRPLEFSGSSHRISGLAAAFRGLPRRRLVIVGGPGTGKTTLCVQLLLELLSDAANSPTEPIPVLMPALEWDPNEQPHVHDFLATHLYSVYPALKFIHPDSAATLVARGRVLPILDGLDETPPARRVAIIDALNKTLGSDTGIILTSRRAEFREALVEKRLHAAAVITPLALSVGDVADYLRRSISPPTASAWAYVLARLESGTVPALRAVTMVPLGLWLLRKVYVETDRDPALLADPIAFPTRQVLQAALLDELIPAVAQTRAQPRRADKGGTQRQPIRAQRPQDLRRWLTTMAEQLRSADSRDWAWWLLPWYVVAEAPSFFASGGWIRRAIGRSLQAEFMQSANALRKVPIFSPFRLNLALAGRSAQLCGSLLVGILPAILFGLLVGPFSVPLTRTLAAIVLSLPLPRLPTDLADSLETIANAPAVTIKQLLVALTVSVVVGAVLGLLIFLLFGGVSGFISALDWQSNFEPAFIERLSSSLGGWLSSARAPDAVSPSSSYRSAIVATRVAAGAGGPAFGVLAGLIFITKADSWIGAALYCFFSLALAICLICLISVISPTGLALSVTVRWLWLWGRWPRRRRMMPVLEDCHRLGLLRAVGHVYQFRHAELQDHLAPRL